MLVRTFFWSVLVTLVVLAGAFAVGGPTTFALVAVLAVLEVSLSFDNAVINATVLVRMSKFWQMIFLTIGIAIAVFGMRLIFPLLLVSATAHLSPIEAFRLALDKPHDYQVALEAAHPAIAAFGGVFLLMIFLDFVFEEREIRWLRPIETPLAKIGKLDQLSVLIALGALALAAQVLAADGGVTRVVLMSGTLGLLTYLLVNGLGTLFEAEGEEVADELEDLAEGGDARPAPAPAATAAANGNGGNGSNGKRIVAVAGKAAFFLFLYLEVLDASFSFDGVVGAFAISSNIFIIAAGLGVGAMYIRSITVYLVNKGTLSEYVYLEHGAHWAIGALAAILLLTIKFEVNEVVTGLIGVAFIGAAFGSSVMRNRAAARQSTQEDSPEPELTRV